MCDEQGKGFGDGINLNRVLTELYAKRRWLDDVIRGLEAVEHSPEVALVTAVEEVLGRSCSPGPKFEALRKRRKRLRPLLNQVRYRHCTTQRSEETHPDRPA